MTRHTLIIAITCLMVGAAVTVLSVDSWHASTARSGSANPEKSQQPLYWVAPMDPNFKRDKPGKSPMGMDLVPVYPSDAEQDAPGTLQIDPAVVNNLGVRTARATRQTLTPTIQTVGYVGYNQDTLVHVHPRIAGWVDKLWVKAAGDYVQQGAPLYALYSPELVNAQEEYLVALQRDNRNLIRAAESRLQALQMPSQAIKQLRASRNILQTVTFFAPQTGFVDNLPIREGFYVEPGTTLMSIGALDEVWVDTHVFAPQAQQIQVGASVSLSLAYFPERTFSGQIDYIYPSLDADTRTVRARVRVPNPDYLLKPNMYASLLISAKQADAQPLLVVPSEAVIRTGAQQRVVLALGAGKFRSTRVQIGQVIGKYTQITAGLAAGDQVVTSAQFLIDSESNIDADLARLSTAATEHSQMAHISDQPAAQSSPSSDYPSATVTGRINHVEQHSRTVNISRAAIEKWDRPATTMDFILAEHIPLTKVEAGMQVEFSFEIRAGDFVIVAISPLPADPHSTMSTEQHAQHADAAGERP